MKPLGRYVLVEPGVDPTMIGSIYVPQQSLETYPQVGWVRGVGPRCKEGLNSGDVVIWPLNVVSTPKVYHPVLLVRFENDVVFRGYPELEPYVHESVQLYRKDSDEDSLVEVESISGEQWSWMASEVLSYEVVDELEHYEAEMVQDLVTHILWIDGVRHFIIHEELILCILREW